MTMILIDGFDHVDSVDVWTSASINIGTATVRTGPRSASGAGAGAPNIAYRALGMAEIDDGVTIGGAFWVGSNFGGFNGGISGPGLVVAEDLDTHISAQFRSDTRQVELWRGMATGGFSTKLAFTDTNIYTFDTWHYLELGVKIADGAGTAEVRLNGATVLTFAGDTRNGGALGVCNRLGFMGTRDVGSPQVVNYDDFYLLNEQGAAPWNTFLGDTRCFPLYPIGNGFYAMLVGSDADSIDNYLLVDEQGAPVSADYVFSAIDGDIDSYEMENLSDFTTVGSVRAVESRVYAAKSETGTKQIRALLRQGGADQTGADHVLAEDAFATYRDIWGPNPFTAAEWTIAEVDATEIGVEVRP